MWSCVLGRAHPVMIMCSKVMLNSNFEQDEGGALHPRRVFKCIESSVVCFLVHLKELVIVLG